MEKETIRDTLLRSPLFNLSLSSKELFHSNFLAWLGEQHPACFLAVFREQGCALRCPDDRFVVKREYQNFDLCLMTPDNRILFILENKVKSMPRMDQLKEYEKKALMSQGSLPEDLMLLSLATEFPQKEEIGQGPWKVRNYHDLSVALQKYRHLLSDDAYAGALVDDYCTFIEGLHCLAQGWLPCPSVPFLLSEAEKEISRELRVGDLQEKIWYARLYEELNTLLQASPSVAECGDLSGIGSDKDYRRKAYTNYGFTHGQGLLEVKIKRSEDYLLLIQLQGDKYCHCIEWITSRPISSDQDAWLQTCALKESLYSFLQVDEAPAVFPSVCMDESGSSRRRKTTQARNYNKYGSRFLYQYRKIRPEATVTEVLQAIREEVEVLIEQAV